MENDRTLTKLTSARKALAEARTVQNVKLVIAIAEAAKVYAKQTKAGQKIETAASEIIVRAKRKLGEMLSLARKRGELATKGNRPKKGNQHKGGDIIDTNISTLDDIGISPKESAEAEAILSIPEDRFEANLQARVENDKVSTAAIIRDSKRTEAIEKTQELAARSPQTVEGQFDVLVVDPPWPMQIIERDVRENQVALDYPVMKEEEILAWSFAQEKAAEHCHVFLWTTHKFLPLAIDCVESWQFKYTCTFVWHKPGGIQPMNFPQLNCEFCVYARKGNPLFIDPKAFNVCFNAPRGEHSEKPELFYSLLRRVTVGRRLDMFNRRDIDGFVGWGKESPND